MTAKPKLTINIDQSATLELPLNLELAWPMVGQPSLCNLLRTINNPELPLNARQEAQKLAVIRVNALGPIGSPTPEQLTQMAKLNRVLAASAAEHANLVRLEREANLQFCRVMSAYANETGARQRFEKLLKQKDLSTPTALDRIQTLASAWPRLGMLKGFKLNLIWLTYKTPNYDMARQEITELREMADTIAQARDLYNTKQQVAEALWLESKEMGLVPFIVAAHDLDYLRLANVAQVKTMLTQSLRKTPAAASAPTSSNLTPTLSGPHP